MESTQYKIGVVGLGVMGRRHCKAIDLIDHAELSAVCDLDPANIELVKSEFNYRNSYTDWAEMFTGEELDLVVVSTNGPTHAEIVISAAKAGIKRILCEKPMATSIQAAQEMIEACAKDGVRLAINHWKRWVPAYLRLKKLLNDGVIGEIRHITFEMAGGQLASNGGHNWDLIRFLTEKEPISIVGEIDKTGTPHPRGSNYSDPGAVGMLWLEDGIRVFFDMFEDYGVPFFMEILGSVGRITIDEKACKWEVSARKTEDRNQPFTRRPPLETIPFEGGKLDIIEGARKLVENLLSDEPIACTGEDGLKSLEMTVAVHESDSQGNKVVKFPLPSSCYNKEFKFT